MSTACGKAHAAFDGRCIPPESPRFAGLSVALRSKYTRASSPGGGSSLARLVSRTPTGRTGPRPSRRSRRFHHRLLSRRLSTSAGNLALILLLGVAAGCGSDADPAPTVPPPPEPPPVGPPPDTLDLPDDPGVFFLEIWEGPGFVPIEYRLGRPPRYAVTVGGDFFYEGPTIEIFPGPLLPNIQRGQLTDEDLSSVIEATAATGISMVGEENIRQPTTGPFIADAPTYEILLRDRQGSHLLRIEALGSEAHTDPRVASVRDLMQRLDLASADIAAPRPMAESACRSTRARPRCCPMRPCSTSGPGRSPTRPPRRMWRALSAGCMKARSPLASLRSSETRTTGLDGTTREPSTRSSRGLSSPAKNPASAREGGPPHSSRHGGA